MLIIKAYVNEKLIDSVWIHNEGEGKKIGECKYKVLIPEELPRRISHERAKGWMPLAIKAFKAILKERWKKEEGR